MIVLDTNVLSEAMRPEPDAMVLKWMNDQAAETLFVSTVTLAELMFGIGALPTGARKNRLARSFSALVELFPNRLLSFDQDAAHHYAQMAVAAREAGRPLPTTDGYIAATAASRGFAVATRNVRDFRATGVEIINPWEKR